MPSLNFSAQPIEEDASLIIGSIDDPFVIDKILFHLICVSLASATSSARFETLPDSSLSVSAP